jgi:hypothetical protein
MYSVSAAPFFFELVDTRLDSPLKGLAEQLATAFHDGLLASIQDLSLGCSRAEMLHLVEECDEFEDEWLKRGIGFDRKRLP